jgi:hypothetical protein
MELTQIEPPKIVGEYEVIIVQSATRVKVEPIKKARKLGVIDALERSAS